MRKEEKKKKPDLKILAGREYAIVKDNRLIQDSKFTVKKNAGNSLTLSEQKLMAYLISRLSPTDKHFDFQEMSIQEFCMICGIDATKGANYSQIKQTISKLARRLVWLEAQNGDEYMARWIADAIIKKRCGTVSIKLDEKLKPFLLQLHSNYTQYPLHNILRMKSKYGIMLYELLKSYYFSRPVIEFSIEDLKIRLDAQEYKNFTNFKKRVLEPALKDINTYSELYVTAEYEKTGRTYTTAIFSSKDLLKSKDPIEQDEARHRYFNTEKELDQISFFEQIDI